MFVLRSDCTPSNPFVILGTFYDKFYKLDIFKATKKYIYNIKKIKMQRVLIHKGF